MLTGANQLETAVHGCHILLILGLVSIMSLPCQVFYAVRSALQKFERKNTHKPCHYVQDMTEILRDAENVQCLILGLTDLMFNDEFNVK